MAPSGHAVDVPLTVKPIAAVFAPSMCYDPCRSVVPTCLPCARLFFLVCVLIIRLHVMHNPVSRML